MINRFKEMERPVNILLSLFIKVICVIYFRLLSFIPNELCTGLPAGCMKLIVSAEVFEGKAKQDVSSAW